MKQTTLAAALVVCVAVPGLVEAAENLRLNPKLDYSSDSRDGPLITGDRMDDGPVLGKPNHIIVYSDG